MQTDFVLDTLKQVLHARRPGDAGLIHHSDRGSQDGFNRLEFPPFDGHFH